MRSRYSPPDTNAFLHRERLCEQLDQAGEQVAIWMQGSPGAGKTVLAASWAQSRKLHCVWNQLDVRDSDPATFIANLSGSLGSREACQALPSLTPEHLPEYEVFARNYFDQFFALLPNQALVILDNYESLASDTISHHLLAIGLGQLPMGVRALITSREHPPAMFARLQANGRLQNLGSTQLSLTPDESASILRIYADSTTRELEELIYRKTRGWVAGVVLLSGYCAEDVKSLHPGDMGTILQYFSNEIYQPAPDAQRRLLVRTAFLPQVDITAQARLCPDVQFEELDLLARKGYFLQRVSGTDKTYRYHPLFREFLQERARREYTPAEMETLLLESARLLAENEEWYEAISLLRNTSCHQELTRLLLQHGMAMLISGRNQSLAQTIGGLPAALLQNYPALLELQGTALLMLSSADAYQCFAQAWEIRCQGNDVVAMLPALAGAMESISLQRFDLSRLDSWTEHFDRLLEQHPDILSNSQAAPSFVSSVLYALSWRDPGHRRLPQLTTLAMEMLHWDLPAALHIKLANAIIINCFWRGDSHVANAVRELLTPLAESSQVPPLLQVVHHAMLTTIFFTLGDTRRCAEQASRTLDLSKEQGLRFFDSSLLSYKLIVALIQGQHDEVYQNLELLAETVAADKQPDHSHYYFCRGWIEHWQGNYQQSDAQFQLAIDCARSNGVCGPVTICQLGQAELAISAGQLDKAERLLSEVEQTIQPPDNPILLFMHAMALSWLALAREDQSMLQEQLSDALQRGARYGFYNWFGLIPGHLSALMVEAVKHNIEPEYVRELIMRHGLVPPAGSVPGERWPWPLKLYTLGRVRIFLHGREMSKAERQRHRKPLELLLALVALGPDGASQKKLADAVWPEAEGDKARKTFDTALYRLRRLLGDDSLLTLNEGQLYLNAHQVWTDLGELSQVYQCVGNKAAPANGTEPDVWAETLAHYQGPFLGDLYTSEWTLEPRKRVETWYVRLNLNLARHQRLAGKHEEAIRLLDTAIEQVPLQEALYRELMLCYRDSRHPAELRNTWERCRQALARELGVEPTEDTRRLLDC